MAKVKGLLETLVKIAAPPSIPIFLSVRPLVRDTDGYRVIGQAVIWLWRAEVLMRAVSVRADVEQDDLLRAAADAGGNS